MPKNLLLQTLDTLFVLGAAELQPDVELLSRRIRVSVSDVAEALLHLETRGLVDAGKVRLTMRGLAAATALHALDRREHLPRAA
ncbi:MAG: hypothetical protein KC416_02105 [Myxococcales bacterium]|nr:hypothetical protein [Myxococcales bacterium]